MLGGLLGIGGGSIIAPLLLVTAALRPAQVSGTTLATVLLISLVGSGAYASLGHMDLGLAWPIALGSVRRGPSWEPWAQGPCQRA